jgi:hypothetical protein
MADLIDRDMAIYELEAFRDSCIANLLRMSFEDITDVVKDIPAVNRWIPVEDALPEKKQKVLVFYKAIGEKNNIHDDVIATNWRKANGDFIPFAGYEITHWMPLPEPPEKE